MLPGQTFTASSLLCARICCQYISKKTFCESNEAASGVSSLRCASCASSERELWISRRTEILRCAQDDRHYLQLSSSRYRKFDVSLHGGYNHLDIYLHFLGERYL